MIKCSSCGRENDDSFKFCLDCGTPLRPDGTQQTPAAPAPTGAKQAAAPARSAPSSAATPRAPTGTSKAAAPAAPPAHATGSKPAPAPAPATEPAPGAEAPAPAEACPKCGAAAKPGDVFCASCGQRLGADAVKGHTMFMHVASPDAAKKPRARLVLIKPDGTEGTVFTLSADKPTILGRSQGVIMFPKDPFISPRHAEIKVTEGGLTLTDLDSLNGVYRKMTTDTPIVPGVYFRIGRQLLRLEVSGDFQPLSVKPPSDDDSQFWGSPVPQVWARLVQVLEGGKIGEIHLLTAAEVMIGREEGDVRFPEDGFISSRHCLLLNKDGDCFLRDLGSSNGTYIRIQGSQPLTHDDRIQIGNQVLKVDLSS